jgi:hypothetical protein
MFQQLRAKWLRRREENRQYKLERALVECGNKAKGVDLQDVGKYDGGATPGF